MLTPDQFKQKLLAQGLTVSQWARNHGYTPRQASIVLNGQSKARYGIGHEIAVKMGIKDGTIEDADNTEAA